MLKSASETGDRLVNDRWKPFFEWVWRLNGVLLLAGLVVCLAGALVLIASFARFAVREDAEEQLTQVAGADLAAQGLRLADFHEIAGTRLLYAQLAAPSEYIASGSGDGFGAARNLLFFDTATQKAHWLLPDNEQTIASFSFLMDPPRDRYGFDAGGSDERERVALAILVEIAPDRRGGDPADATRRLAVASADGRKLTPIVKSTEGLLGYHQAARDSVLVFYVSDGAAKVLDLDPTTRATRSDRVLSAQE
jgi:hypothetical protein